MIKENTDVPLSPGIASQLHAAQTGANGDVSRSGQNPLGAIGGGLAAEIHEQIQKSAIRADDRPAPQHNDSHSLFSGQAKSGNGNGNGNSVGMQRDSGIDTDAASLEALQNYALHAAPFLSSPAAGSQMYSGLVDARRNPEVFHRPALSSSDEIFAQNDIGFIDWCKGIPSSSTTISTGAADHPSHHQQQQQQAQSSTALADALKSAANQRRRRTVPQSRAARTMELFFNRTEQTRDLYSADRLNKLSVRLFPQVDRGFFLSDSDWTCYRRNYFQVSCTFSIIGANGPVSGPDYPCTVSVADGDGNSNGHGNGNGDASSTCSVDRFLVGISAQVASSDKGVRLVQHTPKRDKGPQTTPQPQPIRATDSVSHSALGISTNSICFERLQFKTATANNGKRRAAQQYYVLVVDLLAECTDGSRMLVARSRSSPVVVRGRSPGHYADGDASGATPLMSSISADAHTLPMASSLSASSLSHLGGNASGRESPASASASASASAAAAMAAAMAAAASSGYAAAFPAGDMANTFPGMPPAAMAMAAAAAMAAGGGNGADSQSAALCSAVGSFPTHPLLQTRSASLDSFGALQGLLPTPSPSIGHVNHHLHDPAAHWPLAHSSLQSASGVAPAVTAVAAVSTVAGGSSQPRQFFDPQSFAPEPTTKTTTTTTAAHRSLFQT
ncbi:hypothetical protein LPJ72_004279 [Coemansia sp. Benny D160-2]|nr:hypothetical protein LPJ72_004279 [Coemansia sp. Benny D160-2]